MAGKGGGYALGALGNDGGKGGGKGGYAGGKGGYDGGRGGYDGGRGYGGYGSFRRPPQQSKRCIDHLATDVQFLKDRVFRPELKKRATTVVSSDSSIEELLPPAAYPLNPWTSICSKHVHSASQKDRCAVPALCWTPGARRLLSGSANGMFTLWNGTSFNFETTQQAHEAGIKAMVWSHSRE